MSFMDWIHVGNIAVMAVVAVALFLFRTGDQTGERRGQLANTVKSLQESLDRSKAASSKLGGTVQSLVIDVPLLQRDVEGLEHARQDLVKQVHDLQIAVAHLEEWRVNRQFEALPQSQRS